MPAGIDFTGGSWAVPQLPSGSTGEGERISIQEINRDLDPFLRIEPMDELIGSTSRRRPSSLPLVIETAIFAAQPLIPAP